MYFPTAQDAYHYVCVTCDFLHNFSQEFHHNMFTPRGGNGKREVLIIYIKFLSSLYSRLYSFTLSAPDAKLSLESFRLEMLKTRP